MPQRPPGMLRPDVNPEVLMMLCTAGHVDHGKTRLVRMLTGCNTDRLKTEQERGLTIELGFAPCMLGGELCVGIVDVPGHEKFVKNMVAGVSGIDMTLLVIAADDGVMPQTIEHMQIMELLGVRHGMVALTKTDLVTPERVEELKTDIAEFLKGTFLEGATICPVSSETGEGYFEFYEVLVSQIKGLARKRKCGVFRMPIERVFAQKGFGVVVTGIPVDGVLEVGTQVEVVPGNQTGKIRGIQRFLRDANEGGYGQCLALNIPDLAKPSPVRGQVVCLPGHIKAATCFHVRLHTVAGLESPLRNAELVKLHTGTVEAPAKLYLLEEKAVPENQKALATLVTNEPVAAVPHDRFIIRRASPAATVAGGEILAVTYDKNRPRKKPLLDQLQDYESFFGSVDPISDEGMAKRIAYFLRTERPTGAGKKDIARGVLLPLAVADECLAKLVADKQVVALQEDYYVHDEGYRACVDRAESRIKSLSGEGKSLTLNATELRSSLGNWPPVLWNRVLDELTEKRLIAVRAGKIVFSASAEKLPPADRDLLERIRAVYDETGFMSPRPEELPELLKAQPPRIERLLDYLCNQGELIRLSKNVVIGYTHLKVAQDRVVAVILEKGALDSADFKYVIESSRKYALAILDYLDTRRVTVRIGNNRKLAPNYEKNLL